MTAPSKDAILLEQATEQLRQERETFDQKKQQDRFWFYVRLAMAALSVVLLPSIIVVCCLIIFNHADYPKEIVASAGAALFVDVIGAVIGFWRIVLVGEPSARLAPVTAMSTTVANGASVASGGPGTNPAPKTVAVEPTQ